jgi:hypothetical protein
LKRLPDFDDVEAEERALNHAERYESLLQALAFLVSWPAVDRAARLVVTRAGELDGDHYEILSPAADVLASKHPLAATLLLRAMVDFTLTKARSSRYRHAARHFMECASLAAAIGDFGAFESHGAYAARLAWAQDRFLELDFLKTLSGQQPALRGHPLCPTAGARAQSVGEPASWGYEAQCRGSSIFQTTLRTVSARDG